MKTWQLLMYLVDVNSQCGTIGKSISTGSTHIEIPWLTSSSYQSNLLCQWHWCSYNLHTTHQLN